MQISLFILCLIVLLPTILALFLGYSWGRKQGREALEALQQENTRVLAQAHQKTEHIEELKQSISLVQDSFSSQTEKLGQLKSDKLHLEQALKKGGEAQQELQEKFRLEFENLAHKILKQNTDQFSSQNKQQIGEILSPLKEKLGAFEKRINDVYTEETKQRSEIKQQIFQLMEMNQVISTDAKNLTKALKGDTKAQGNWGELILERVLESSGLVKNEEYSVQYSDNNDQGKRIQPDVIIHLPEGKHLIIDSKVSLLAYDGYVNAETEQDHDKQLKNHLISVKTHIKTLSEKRYETAKNLIAPDFVLLFMPLEGAFGAALQNDSSLYAYAWKHNIVLVSPTTLLATLKTIASIWKQERQTKNALEIAEKAGGLYDKFVGFLGDMESIEKGIGNAYKAYGEAKNKLIEGKGNLVSRIEGLKKLGAKAKESKAIPSSFNPEEIAK